MSSLSISRVYCVLPFGARTVSDRTLVATNTTVLRNRAEDCYAKRVHFTKTNLIVKTFSLFSSLFNSILILKSVYSTVFSVENKNQICFATKAFEGVCRLTVAKLGFTRTEKNVFNHRTSHL